VTWVSGGAVFLNGVFVYDGDETKGIHVYEGGHSGYRAADYTASATFAGRVNAISPALVVIALGLNEFGSAGSQRTSTQYKADLSTLIANLRTAGVTASFLLVTPYDPTGQSPVATNAEPFSAYVAAAQSIADSDTGGPNGASGVAHLPLSAAGRLPPTTGLASGLYVDGFHAADAGHSWYADIMVGALSA
jgi:lysophospholipase L1-like esterase